MSEGRRTLKVNLGRRCTMCEEDPRQYGQARPGRIPHYHPTMAGVRLMICLIHDRPDVRLRLAWLLGSC